MIEIIHKDLLARIARFQTKSGIVETPTFIPVVHPTRVLIPPRTMYDEFGCKLIITNAYLLSKTDKKGSIHDILDYPGVIMTDSGAYQLLTYGDVEITPKEIIELQDEIKSDIAVILDVPTGGQATYQEALGTVKETLRRAKESISQRTNPDVIWVGPIQGGTFPDLVAKSAQEIAKLDFPIIAIGSPTQLMEQYHFSALVDLVMAAKTNIPVDKPVHLFGAGHPIIFPLIVAMGCDLFDSAAYALFAKHDRILTPEGTYKLQEIHDDFCSCPACSKFSITEIKHLEKRERIALLAEHNLRICQNEIKRIKQAIREGRLWRLVESRLGSHPALVDAMKKFVSHQKLIEKYSPITKKRALFITSKWSVLQPEIIRHQARMTIYSPPRKQNSLLIISAPKKRPYHKAKEFERFKNQYSKIKVGKSIPFDVLFVSPYFGLIPLEITNVYPLAQNEIPESILIKNQPRVLEQLKNYLLRNSQYTRIFAMFLSTEYWHTYSRQCRRMLKELEKECKIFHTDFSNQSIKKLSTHLTIK
jgi:7-cyano-7-deazaguanine tRNA-ribosyltransferase